MQTIDMRSNKEKWEQLKWRASNNARRAYEDAKKNVNEAVQWVAENPAEAVAIGGMVIAGVNTGIRLVTKVGGVITDHNNKLTIYCNDIQSDVRLKHELKYNEARELRDLMNMGYTKFEALDTLGLLKK